MLNSFSAALIFLQELAPRECEMLPSGLVRTVARCAYGPALPCFRLTTTQSRFPLLMCTWLSASLFRLPWAVRRASLDPLALGSGACSHPVVLIGSMTESYNPHCSGRVPPLS